MIQVLEEVTLAVVRYEAVFAPTHIRFLQVVAEDVIHIPVDDLDPRQVPVSWDRWRKTLSWRKPKVLLFSRR